MPNQLPALLTVQDVATKAGRSVRTVHRAIDAGDLAPAMRAGVGDNAPYLFTEQEAQRWVEGRKTTASSGTTAVGVTVPADTTTVGAPPPP